MPARHDDGGARAALVAACRRLDRRGLVAGSAGNLSLRLASGDLLITPTGGCLAELEPAEAVLLSVPDGGVLGGARPSMEAGLHLGVYRRRADVGAVVHAHPLAVVALSLAGVTLSPVFLPESVLVLGRVAEVGAHPPGSPELAGAVAAALEEHDAVVLERHGAVTVGRDLTHAVDRMECLDFTARALLAARSVGDVTALDEDAVLRLEELAACLRASRK